jgi:hypothetical protein
VAVLSPFLARPRQASEWRDAEWKDDMQSFSNTEPAIDLTASSPLAFARQMAGQT